MKIRRRQIFFLFLLLLSLFFAKSEEIGTFYRFSMDSMERFFSSRKAREIFGVDEEEAVAVFGSQEEEVFL